MLFPGFIDVHVHFRDPGMPAAETTATGLAAAAKGGFAAVVTMPNTSPACDSPELMHYQRLAAAHSRPQSHNLSISQSHNLPIFQSPNHPISQSPNHPITQSPNLSNLPILFPSACITKGRQGAEVAELEKLADAGAAFFTDDGSYVTDDKVMEEAMQRTASLGMCICQHAMDPCEQAGGVIRDCPLARKLDLPVIPVSAETMAIKRDLSICRVTGCRLHIQHISTAEGVELVRNAQREGLPVTAEATPHHLLLSCEEIPADDANYKMAPPLGNHEDRAELRRAVQDGVLMFATDHAPHPAETKSRGFAASANGIIGLETAIPITYHVMVEECGMDVEAWARAWWQMPRSIIRDDANRLASLHQTEIAIGEKRRVDVSSFASLSRNCPYDGLEFSCWPVV